MLLEQIPRYKSNSLKLSYFSCPRITCTVDICPIKALYRKVRDQTMSVNHIDPNLQEQRGVYKFYMIQILPSGLENSEEPYHILRLLLCISMILLRDT